MFTFGMLDDRDMPYMETKKETTAPWITQLKGNLELRGFDSDLVECSRDGVNFNKVNQAKGTRTIYVYAKDGAYHIAKLKRDSNTANAGDLEDCGGPIPIGNTGVLLERVSTLLGGENT